MYEFNNQTRVIADLVNVNRLVRETLEYATNRQSYDIKAYNARKAALGQFVAGAKFSSNDEKGEAGDKLNERLKTFYDTIYGDDSTVVTVRGEEVVADSAQHFAIFDNAIPVYLSLRNVIMNQVNIAKKQNMFDYPTLDEVIKEENRFFPGFVHFILFGDLERFFLEYNKARNEAKGAITPQSNFIEKDLVKITQIMAVVRQNALVTTADYYEYIDPLFALIEMTNGRRDLPVGKNFQAVFNDVKNAIAKYVNAEQVTYQTVFSVLFQEAVEDSKKRQQEAAQKAEENSPKA